jgi:hypothetical protein
VHFISGEVHDVFADTVAYFSKDAEKKKKKKKKKGREKTCVRKEFMLSLPIN